MLVICENVKPSRFFLEMYDAESGRPLGERSGVKIDDPELYSWSGPLALALGGKGSLLAEGNLCHHEPVGLEQANALGQRSLQQGRFYPYPPMALAG